MIKRICRWLISDELLDQYVLGWSHAVDQMRMDPDSALHHTTYDEDGHIWLGGI